MEDKGLNYKAELYKQPHMFIDTDEFINCAQGVIIMCASTGLIANVQVGGIACIQEVCEGYAIPLIITSHYSTLSHGLRELNDCGWGCMDNCQDKAAYGKAIDYFLKYYINCYNLLKMKFQFDYDRNEEVKEGWWPVSVYYPSSNYSDTVDAYLDKVHKGYLHMGNCD